MTHTGRRTAVPVRVEVTANLDGVVLIPRGVNVEVLRGSLASAGVAARRGAGGYVVPQNEFGRLLLDKGLLDIRWGSGAKRFVSNRHNLPVRHAAALARLRELMRSGRPETTDLLRDAHGAHALDDHQAVSVAAMVIPESPGLCVLDEQGTGKTVVAIFAYDVLVGRGEVEFALIVAPKSMVPEWVRDFTIFKGDLYKAGTMAGSRREKRAALGAGYDVLVTNYETALSMESEIIAAIRRYAGRAMLVVDESFLAKNFDAARTRAVRRIREECDRGYVLCGTPAPNAPHDVVEQFNIADFGATFSGLAIPQDRDTARPVIQQALETRGLFVRHLKRDVMPHLPGRRFTRVSVPFEPVQRAAYRAALDSLLMTLTETGEPEFEQRIPSFLAKRSALLQICSSPGSVIDGYSVTPGKLLALDSILDDAIVRRGEKVVVWSYFTASVNAIFDRYAQFGPVRYDGTVADVSARREAVRRFQEDDDSMLFVANPAAAGAGLTLHRSRIAVYESLSNQPAHYLQSLDRVHRRGQDREVEYVFLVCEESIEVQEYERIAAKEAAARELLGDPIAQAVTRDLMLLEAYELRQLLEPGV